MRGQAWSRLHFPCCVHTAANIHTKGLLDFQSDVSGVINMALYLRLGEHMSRFRESLALQLADKVTISRGHPAPEMILQGMVFSSTLCSRTPSRGQGVEAPYVG